MGCLFWFRNLIYVLLLSLYSCMWYHDILHHVITALDCILFYLCILFTDTLDISNEDATHECHSTSPWQVNIGSGNGSVPSGSKSLPEAMLIKIYFSFINFVEEHTTKLPPNHWNSDSPIRMGTLGNPVIFPLKASMGAWGRRSPEK